MSIAKMKRFAVRGFYYYLSFIAFFNISTAFLASSMEDESLAL